MVRDICHIRFCVYLTHFSIFTMSSMEKFCIEIDLRRPSCGLYLGSTIIAGGMLKKPANVQGRCYDIVVQFFDYTVINVNNNFIRVNKNLGPKVGFFNRIIRP